VTRNGLLEHAGEDLRRLHWKVLARTGIDDGTGANAVADGPVVGDDPVPEHRHGRGAHVLDRLHGLPGACVSVSPHLSGRSIVAS
jgi:hypothetical protein